MTPRRSRYAPALSALFLLLAAFGGQQARAGVFDDDEARRQIKDLSIQANERLETLSKGQFDLVNQLQALREENARLRGQVETLTYELESTKKRQQDFYVDLDNRLRKFESASAGNATGEGKPAEEDKPAGEAPKKVVVDPAAESRDYEAALNLFKANKIKEAAVAFDAFGKSYPESTLAPNAQYWLGNAYYALRDQPENAIKILEEFGLNPDTGRIINGHVPVKVAKGERPIKANGRLIVIDGGFSRAYQRETGIADQRRAGVRHQGHHLPFAQAFHGQIGGAGRGVVVAPLQPRLQAVGGQQLGRDARVLGQNQIGGGQNVQRPEGDVPQIADRGGDQIEAGLHPPGRGRRHGSRQRRDCGVQAGISGRRPRPPADAAPRSGPCP